MEKAVEVSIEKLTPWKALPFLSLAPYQWRSALYRCDREDVLAVGASDEEGKPCGLALALVHTQRDGNEHFFGEWVLRSVYVREDCRRQGCGRRLTEALLAELALRGCRKLNFQLVAGDEETEGTLDFLRAVGFADARKCNRIHRFSWDGVADNPLVKGARTGAFRPDHSFRIVTADELPENAWEEIKENKDGGYPVVLSPLTGRESLNEKCSVFALDAASGRVAGWLTVLDVNRDTFLLYRALFVREEYRSAQLGLSIVAAAVKNHWELCPEKRALFAVSLQNERFLRFCELFLRDNYEHISYDILASRAL